MIFLQLLVFIALSTLSYGERCKTPKPMDDFSLEQFSGEWYQPAVEQHLTNNVKTKVQVKDNKCVILNIIFNNGTSKQNKWHIDRIVGDRVANMDGEYFYPEPGKGFLKMFFPLANITYDFTILCSDYISYAAAYACTQAGPEEISELFIVNFREKKRYDEVDSTKDMEKCFEGLITKGVKEIEKRPFDDCSHA